MEKLIEILKEKIVEEPLGEDYHLQAERVLEMDRAFRETLSDEQKKIFHKIDEENNILSPLYFDFVIEYVAGFIKDVYC